ncbi:MAG TPA: DUF2442 domain-containing protein [Ignavibacteriales bacterium]|nr:DUF2442 domain-containing protein [Ignavibacteriales bacterium]
MKAYHKIKNLRFIDDKLFLTIDGTDFSFNIHSLSKKFLNASKVERDNFKISPSGYGIHWPLLDEDISIDGLLKLTHNKSIMNKKKVVI